MSTGHSLLSEATDDEGEMSYTDKQVRIIKSALKNPGASVDDIADMTDSHVTYVRSVLGRTTVREAEERLSDFPMPEEEPEAMEEANDTVDYEEVVRLMEEDDLTREEAIERLTSKPEEEAVEEPEETQEPAAEAEAPAETMAGTQPVSEGDSVSITLDVPHSVVDQFAQALAEATESPGLTVPSDMAQWVSEEFDVPEERAERIVLRIGTERVEEIMGEEQEPEEMVEEIAEPQEEQSPEQ